MLNGQTIKISTHTPLAGRDDAEIKSITEPLGISTHTPLAGRDPKPLQQNIETMISTHTPLAGRDENFIDLLGLTKISTHTPLAGRDSFKRRKNKMANDFYSHAPCGT